ncbi:MAG TPA: methanogen output domain 1-containing protein [Candidatus Deferrimicrobium sp.]|nr:methanogen output domain 1-containing protein [Candidatus Deferrimicrobium sp.]
MAEQLKFIASVFKMVIAESNKVVGPETIQTIFRLIGESQGEAVERRLKEKYKVDNWTLEQFANAFVKDVLEPALGAGQADFKIENNEVTIKIKVCPFKAASMKISDKLYCTYTQGLVDQSFNKALKNIEFESKESIADRNPECIFKIKIK